MSHHKDHEEPNSTTTSHKSPILAVAPSKKPPVQDEFRSQVNLAPTDSITRTLHLLNNTNVKSALRATTNFPARTFQSFLDSSSPSPLACAMRPSHSMITHAKAGIFQTKAFAINIQPTSPLFEPSSSAFTLLCPQGKSTMEDEITALPKNRTWSLVPPQLHQRLIGNKWIFKIKRHPN